MTRDEAIEIMCRRCVNHEICSGTGCGPLRTLKEESSCVYEFKQETRNLVSFLSKLKEEHDTCIMPDDTCKTAGCDDCLRMYAEEILRGDDTVGKKK